MIYIKFNIRSLLLVGVLLSLLQLEGYSQGTDIRSRKQKHFYFGFSSGAGQTSIVNTGTATISQLKSNKKSSFSGSFDIGYTFVRAFGISTGVGYSTYATDLTLASYTNAYDTTDSEHEQYNRRISGKNITETQKISFLYIPLALNLQIPFSKSFGLYIQTGINFSLPMQKNFNSTGTFSYSGYYSAYNILITNINYEGFKSDYKNNVNGELNLKSLNQEFFGSAGFQVTIHNSVAISIGAFYNKMLSDISDKSSTGAFRLSSKPNQMRSLMDGSSKVTVGSMGLKISLRFYL